MFEFFYDKNRKVVAVLKNIAITISFQRTEYNYYNTLFFLYIKI